MPMNPAANDDFREQLSAWHDGALPDEASRFVLKRLLQDEALRAEVGRWQLVGDVLRRDRPVAAAGDIASRVAAALEAERLAVPAVAKAGGTTVGRSSALRWTATAAAVGLAAVLVWPASSPTPQLAAPTAIAAMPEAPAIGMAVRAASPALRDTPAPLVAVPARDPDARVASVPPLMRAPQPTPEQLAPLPAVDVPSRPWPRGGAVDGAYTVEYAVPSAVPAAR